MSLKSVRFGRLLSVVLFAVSMSLPNAFAQSASPLTDENLAARVNGQPIHRLSLEVMAHLAQAQEPGISRAVVLETLLANRLLAQASRQKFAEFALHEAGSRVAFATDVALNDQLSGHLRNLFQQEIESTIKAMPGANLNSLISEYGQLAPAELDQVFGDPGKLLLSYDLSPEQLERAKRVMVLRSKLPGMAQMTLYDVYRRQNVQGRVEFFQRNIEFMRQQAMTYLASLYVLDWANQRFGAAAVADLRQVFAEQTEVRALMALHGIGADTDAHSELLDQLASRVTQKEVQQYYLTHKEEFKRIDWVQARHIRLADQPRAEQILARAKQGENFAALAREFSTADDAKSGGNLGRIKHQGKLSWLAELAFMQEEGKISSLFRAPVGPHEAAYWEMILLEKIHYGYQDPRSEGVRYLAGRAIAQEKAGVQISQLRSQLLKNAKIEVNRQLLLATPNKHPNKNANKRVAMTEGAAATN